MSPEHKPDPDNTEGQISRSVNELLSKSQKLVDQFKDSLPFTKDPINRHRDIIEKVGLYYLHYYGHEDRASKVIINSLGEEFVIDGTPELWEKNPRPIDWSHRVEWAGGILSKGNKASQYWVEAVSIIDLNEKIKAAERKVEEYNKQTGS